MCTAPLTTAMLNTFARALCIRNVLPHSLAGSHTWRVTASVGSSMGMKAMLRAGKILAAGAYELICSPDLQKKAIDEWKAAKAGKEYVCPIDDSVAYPYEK